MVKANKTRVCISLSKVMDNKLAEMSEITGLTKSNLICVAIANFITANEMIQNKELKNALNNSMLKFAKDIENIKEE